MSILHSQGSFGVPGGHLGPGFATLRLQVFWHRLLDGKRYADAEMHSGAVVPIL